VANACGGGFFWGAGKFLPDAGFQLADLSRSFDDANALVSWHAQRYAR
jgi:hypothetical protein